jgi:hypothetical protein
MPTTPSSGRSIPGGGVHEPPQDRPEETVRATPGFYLRCRYWGRVLILGVMVAMGLGLIDAVIPILNWQLALVALCLVTVLAVWTREQLLCSISVLLPATGVQLTMYVDRPDTQRSMILWFSVALCLTALHLLTGHRPRRAPRRVVLNLGDGRQIPLAVGQARCPQAQHWEAVSANGPIYLTDGWSVSHGGRRRAVVEPVIYHDEQGRAYVPDLRDLRDVL